MIIFLIVQMFLCKLIISAIKACWFGILYLATICFKFLSKSSSFYVELASLSSILLRSLDSVYSRLLIIVTLFFADEHFL